MNNGPIKSYLVVSVCNADECVPADITFGHLEIFLHLYTAYSSFHILALAEFSILIIINLSFELLLVIEYNIHDN